MCTGSWNCLEFWFLILSFVDEKSFLFMPEIRLVQWLRVQSHDELDPSSVELSLFSLEREDKGWASTAVTNDSDLINDAHIVRLFQKP